MLLSVPVLVHDSSDEYDNVAENKFHAFLGSLVRVGYSPDLISQYECSSIWIGETCVAELIYYRFYVYPAGFARFKE